MLRTFQINRNVTVPSDYQMLYKVHPMEEIQVLRAGNIEILEVLFQVIPRHSTVNEIISNIRKAVTNLYKKQTLISSNVNTTKSCFKNSVKDKY